MRRPLGAGQKTASQALKTRRRTMKHKPREASNRLLEIVLDLAAVKGHIGLFPHERFDADAIGAAVSLSRAFRSLGCRTTVLTDEQVPPSLLELPGLEDIVVHDSDRE